MERMFSTSSLVNFGGNWVYFRTLRGAKFPSFRALTRATLVVHLCSGFEFVYQPTTIILYNYEPTANILYGYGLRGYSVALMRETFYHTVPFPVYKELITPPMLAICFMQPSCFSSYISEHRVLWTLDRCLQATRKKQNFLFRKSDTLIDIKVLSVIYQVVFWWNH